MVLFRLFNCRKFGLYQFIEKNSLFGNPCSLVNTIHKIKDMQFLKKNSNFI
uniref:Uncharacterized protein n=1 Tax=Arundo donax TaxID=35708 RepID=A0A0A8Z1T9_ARUDO